MRELGGHHAPEVCVHMYDTRIGRQFSRAKEEEITDCVTSTAVLSSIVLSFSDFLPVQEFIWRYFHYTEFSNESCKHQGEKTQGQAMPNEGFERTSLLWSIGRAELNLEAFFPNSAARSASSPSGASCAEQLSMTASLLADAPR